MSKKLFYLLGIVATIILGTLLHLQFCCNCCMPTKTVQDTETAIKTFEKNRNPFVLNGIGMNYQCNDNLNFLENNAALITPVSDSILMGLEKLKAFLIAHPDQKITIKGYATSSEKNETKFENLGLARANDIKTFFVSKGLSQTQFETKGQILNSWETSNSTLLGPIVFYFNEADVIVSNNSDVSAFKNELNANPLVLYFDSNQSNDNVSKEDRQKILDIANYISKTPNATVIIVGHSDNTGARQANIILAQKRANFTKNYLIKNGIRVSRIQTQSKGPDEPIAENETSEGKAKNRRTVITIK